MVKIGQNENIGVKKINGERNGAKMSGENQ
jgi:hypothetical protein